MTVRRKVAGLVPGLLLCAAVAAAAFVVERLELRAFGRAWLEALVLAILLGAALRTAWTPTRTVLPGVNFAAHTLLEVAIVLLGASVSAAAILSQGPRLLIGVVAVVAMAIVGGYALARLLKLPRRMAMLVACGNAICGNSAIAAVAPVIGADGDDVAASITFTAVLGVAVVLLLPLSARLLGFGPMQYGTLAGLTVYAVPQVLAATAPFGIGAMHAGTLVKLMRVLTLGPVILALSWVTRSWWEEPRFERQQDGPEIVAGDRASNRRPKLHRLVPWFIVGFLLMVGARSVGWLPDPVAAVASRISAALTVLSMAALGLGVDVRAVARAGPRVAGAVTLSLVLLAGVSIGLIRLLRVA